MIEQPNLEPASESESNSETNSESNLEAGDPQQQQLEKQIQLDQFLKAHQLVASGGQAKHIIQSGGVLVNGEVETRRSRKLHHGDTINFEDEDFVVEFEADSQ